MTRAAGAMSAERLAEIEVLAKAAPAGPWHASLCDDGVWMVASAGDVICLADPNCQEPDGEEPIAYIAAVDPPTVLTLIAEIRSLARRLGEAEHKVAGLQAGRAVLVQERDEAWAAAGAFAGHCCVPRPGEPFFVLLGRDAQAPSVVEAWASAREAAKPGDDKVAGARVRAAEMRAFARSALGRTREGVSIADDGPENSFGSAEL